MISLQEQSTVKGELIQVIDDLALQVMVQGADALTPAAFASLDGITFLKKLMQFKPIPVIVISSLGHAGAQASIDALRAGAVEILCKPNGPCSVGELGITLSEKIRTAAASHVRIRSKQETAAAGKPPARVPEVAAPIQFASDKIIAIGASTGGPGAVAEVLAALPANCPPVLIVQHMPAVFTTHFAARLNQECRMEVKEAVDGDLVLPGRALVAPGNLHMTLKQSSQGYYVKVGEGPPVCFSRPSVDVLFTSVAGIARKKALGVLLTGMGADGARGLLEMRKSGAYTIAQNEESCVVFGMPKEAIRLEAAQSVLPLNQIAGAIVRHISQSAPQLLVSKAS
jgi:two-component system chemotaxis response regulator CheB